MKVIFSKVVAFTFVPLMVSQGPTPLLPPVYNSEFAELGADNPLPMRFGGKADEYRT